MTPLENQIIATWLTHNKINFMMLGHIPDEALGATLSARGGRDIAKQFAHIHAVRCMWLDAFAKKMGVTLMAFGKDESPDKNKLAKALEQSGKLMVEFIESSFAKQDKISDPKKGIVPLLGYFISHESHHRGSILLTMKQSGFKIPDELKWGIWDWGKV